VTIRRNAHAKLNVSLRVLGRRDDGFHDIETLILPLELHDVIEASPAAEVSIEVIGPLAGELADAGGDDLAAAAARALIERCTASHPHGAEIRVDKHIPIAAGLGGGSADAAATLLALLAGEPVFCEGRGDVVHPAHAQTTYWVVKPFRFAIRAADAYSWWDEDGASTGPDQGVLIAAIESGNDALTGDALWNDLEAPAVRRHPAIGRTIDAFVEAGALGAIMTGSGPTVVALAQQLGHADRLAQAVEGSFVTSGPPRTMTSRSGVV
jgi:4-diphosphocytidyl-2-C-methyl-D-erythritol kinase